MKRRTLVLRIVIAAIILAVVVFAILLISVDLDSLSEDTSSNPEVTDASRRTSIASPQPSNSPLPPTSPPTQTTDEGTPDFAATASAEMSGPPPTQPPPTQPPPTAADGSPAATGTGTPTAEVSTNGTDGVNQEVISSVPTQVAVVIRDDETGQIIGDGNLRLFAPESVAYPETALVELELRFRNQYITPTPFGLEITRVPVVTATPLPGKPTPTEAVPIYEELNVQFFDVMGATLFCLEQSFEGCDGEPNSEIDSDGARPIDLNGTNWRWILAPNSAAQGIQNLDIRLWTLDDQERVSEIWDRPISIEVNPGTLADEDDDSVSSLLPVAAITLSVIALATVLGFVGWRNFKRRRSPRIFISYRRQDSQGSAGRLYDRLRERFGDGTIFRDVDTIGFGSDFVKDIHDAIDKSDVVIVVIGNNWLSIGDDQGNLRIYDPDDFVRLELATALAKEKRVIPTLVDDADMPDAEILPEDLRSLAFRNAVHIRNDSFDDDVNRLLRQLLEEK